MRIHRFALLVLAMAIALSGCSRKSEEQPKVQSEEMKPASAHRAAQAAASAPNVGLQFTAPTDWIAETPTSSNRRAQYKLPRAAGDAEDAEMAVYNFPGGGGTPQANVDRWLSQFTKADGSPAADSAKVVKKTIGSIPVTIVDIGGTYAGSMMMMQQASKGKPHVRMLAAIAETSSGPWFFKLTGPENSVKKYQLEFDAFINSIRQK
jgi:hypothetical protein